MKRCFKNIKIKALLLLCCLAWAQVSFAKSTAMVHSVTGKVFALHEGKSWYVRAGDLLPDFAEVFTEEGGQVTFSDFYDHQFHLAGSGHIKLLQGLVDLKAGYLWFQVLAPNRESHIQTANARASFKTGEGVISFDANEGKTQLLSIKGKFVFGNILQEEMSVELDDGHFSFVQKEHEEGRPRNPTPIGFGSFKKVTSLFYGVSPLTDTQNMIRPVEEMNVVKEEPVPQKVERHVASVQAPHPVMQEEVKKVTPPAPVVSSNSGKAPGSVYLRKIPPPVIQKKFSLKNFYSDKLKKARKENAVRKAKRVAASPSGVKVKVFGYGRSKSKRAPASHKSPGAARKPASFKAPKAKIPLIINPQVSIKKTKDFESTLVDQYKKQMRHEEEVNNLIEDLQNYDQDYKQNY